ncbi:thioredoxin domain-containing protein [Candidatus Saccharibacteria bacterium]|nr:thioredoxin domain-containing protein [Candidatus Saccharibacteria bacterium]
MKSRALTTTIFIIVLLLLGALIMFNMYGGSSTEDHADKVWNEGTTLGNMDAKNYYIMYTDLACPYCDAFSRQIAEHEEEFITDYIEGKDILFEVRVTEFLKLYSEHKPNMSEWSAEGVYCARNEGKFWEYYHAALRSLWDDYQSQGVGASKTSPAITNMTADYWLNIGHKLGLSSNFDTCFNEHQMLPEIRANTERAAKNVDGGLPYFKFGSFTNGGFDTNWGWDYVKQYLDSGLKK